VVGRNLDTLRRSDKTRAKCSKVSASKRKFTIHIH